MGGLPGRPREVLRNLGAGLDGHARETAPSGSRSTMRLRNAADVRTLFWVFLLTPLTVAVQFLRPDWVPYLSWLSCYFALACGVIAHNHNHSPTFEGKRVNVWFGNWLSIFYGYPTFAWIPTHNLNHHKFVNRAGDATITWRYTNRHNFFVAVSYFFVSSWFQAGPINEFIRKAREKNPSLYRRIVLQYSFWLGAHAVLLAGAIALHGVKTGLYVWSLACLVPALFALWTIMLFNYEQHVHADPWSRHNHSRSWDGKIVNFLLFNNGLHAAHHENAGTHWSKLWEVHRELAPKIDPRLIERSMWWYFVRQYFVAMFIPSLGSTQIGRAPFEPPDGREQSLQHAEVDLGDAGSNARMLAPAE
jgi:fatty acid desaturase